jgi:aminoglycoside 3-N-acetyltransferase I
MIPNPEIRQLSADDLPLMEGLLRCFGEAFNEIETYTANPPSEGYLRQLLSGDSFIALAALVKGEVVGGIAAYELRKFEQERSEIYIYDLAVVAGYRRKGIATAMIEKLKEIAVDRRAHAVFVQADTGVEDEPAIALYRRFGRGEDVLHFDIALEPKKAPQNKDGVIRRD